MYRTTVCNSAATWNTSRCCGTTTVPAGSACQSDICGEGELACDTQRLATLMMENQEYVEGFCPCEALSCGTLFPCLVM